MDDTRHAPPLERLVESVEDSTYEAVSGALGELRTASAEDRKQALRALRRLADDRPTAFESFLPDVTPFLTDDDRAVRLLTAKALVTVAAAAPDAVAPAIPSLAERLADEDEFYYVRARSAEALGYVALEHPDAVASPAVLADLRVGLSFDEPEVKQKLAKALECVALGDPSRLRHRVSALAEHLDDGDELVRYHLCTAVVVVGCGAPGSIAEARTALSARLTDENAFVRGRAAEALGLLARGSGEAVRVPDSVLDAESDEAAAFVAERVRFLRAASAGGSTESPAEGVGSLAGVRDTTDDAVTEITSSDADGECPHCGVDLPEGAPPMCPSCGAPY
ncbi:HEAT repeat domain-containing protein [Haloferax sp. AB510]|uniref:HEAT repeat domain-containing protein n=1 Tax=Haloferax sp. AB510 TaxID=2934172 RepID=UPI00209BFDA7|nr:HEAT repeat domain-containing protein [Haloferax sp. AB510]MCO8267675.1 HEAT repeat domain-containing protein [Haloferax sp. AB510]